MGKQVNFYIDKEAEIQFLEFLKTLDLVFIFCQEFQLYCSKDPEAIRHEVGYLSGYLHKEEWGDLDISCRLNYKGEPFYSFCTTSAPVIELHLSANDLSDTKLSRSRIYVQMQYWENDEQVRKPTEMDKMYQKIARWLKKHIPYQEYDWKGYKRKKYISNSLLELIKNGKIEHIQ